MYKVNINGKEWAIKQIEECFYNLITRLQSEQYMKADEDIRVIKLFFTIINDVDDRTNNKLLELFNNSDFIWLAKCISEKRAFYYEPRKEEK